MKMTFTRRLLGLLLVTLAFGCEDGTAPPAGISVSVAPVSASLLAGGFQDFTATVANDPAAQGVTWSLTACTGGAAVCGGLTNVTPTTATYAAPVPIPSDVQPRITATSVTDNARSITVTIAIAAIRVSVSPSAGSIVVDGTRLFATTVSNDPTNSGVTWSLTGCAGGAAVCGTLTDVASTTATYTAPTTVPPGPVGITATSVADNTKSFTANLAVIVSGAAGRIAFTSGRGCTPEIHAMNVDGSGVEQLTNSLCLANSGGAAWSPDGMKIAFDNGDNLGRPRDIFVMNADGSEPTRLIRPTDSTLVGRTDPAWSHDGTKIAAAGEFLVHITRCPTPTGCPSYVYVYRIVVMNPDGSGLVVLTGGREPAWSPEGNIAFSVGNSIGGTDIWTRKADGTGVKNLTNNPATTNDGPAWSPDGTKIAFHSTRSGVSDLYVMNADGSGVTPLTADTATEGRPAWSPDGTKIAFASTRDGSYEIYVMNADGSGVVRLTDNPAFDARPAWAP